MKIVVILEDESEREMAMTNVLSDVGDVKALVFNNPWAVVEWLKEHPSECALISLDHDLGRIRSIKGELVKPGTGWDVVDYMVTQPPSCPVILHTGNREAGDGMREALERSKWNCRAVIPYPPDLDWVSKDWRKAVRSLLQLI